MGTAIFAGNESSVRLKRKRRYSYSEDADEAPALVEQEPVEVEHELPSEDNRWQRLGSVESCIRHRRSVRSFRDETLTFEEWGQLL